MVYGITCEVSRNAERILAFQLTTTSSWWREKEKKEDSQRPLTFYHQSEEEGKKEKKKERQSALFVTMAPAVAINSSGKWSRESEAEGMSQLVLMLNAILTSVFECSDDQSESISSFTMSVCHVLESQVI